MLVGFLKNWRSFFLNRSHTVSMMKMSSRIRYKKYQTTECYSVQVNLSVEDRSRYLHSIHSLSNRCQSLRLPIRPSHDNLLVKREQLIRPSVSKRKRWVPCAEILWLDQMVQKLKRKFMFISKMKIFHRKNRLQKTKNQSKLLTNPSNPQNK